MSTSNGRVARYNQSDIMAFINRTGSDEDQANFFLEATQGNLEAAIDMYYSSGSFSHYLQITFSHIIIPFTLF